MFNILFIINYYICYFKTILGTLLPFNEIILINEKTLGIIPNSILNVIIFNLLSKKYLNYYFKDYKIICKYKEKYYYFETIDYAKQHDNLNCSLIQKIYLTSLNKDKNINITNEIKKFNNDFKIIDFFLINNLPIKDINKICIEYIPIFNLKKREISSENFLYKNINFLIKN
jgi:hypothetical protein